jgi:hypothetical protein
MLQFNKTILRQCSNGFVRIMAKKHLSENPFTSDTSRLLKLVEFMLRRRIQAYHQVTRQWSVFMHRFSAFRRNPRGEQTGNWMMSLTWQCGGCYVSDFLRPFRFQMLQELKPNDRPRQRDFVTDMVNRLKKDSLFWDKIAFSDEAIPFTFQGRWIAII